MRLRRKQMCPSNLPWRRRAPLLPPPRRFRPQSLAPRPSRRKTLNRLPSQSQPRRSPGQAHFRRQARRLRQSPQWPRRRCRRTLAGHHRVIRRQTMRRRLGRRRQVRSVRRPQPRSLRHSSYRICRRRNRCKIHLASKPSTELRSRRPSSPSTLRQHQTSRLRRTR